MRDYFKRFKRGGLDELLRINFVGSEALLDREQVAELDAHLRTTIYSTAAAVVCWVATTFGVQFTVSGMTAMLRRLGYTYMKPKLVHGKADTTRQEAHVEAYRKLRNNKQDGDVILFTGNHSAPLSPTLPRQGEGSKRASDLRYRSLPGRERTVQIRSRMPSTLCTIRC